jgi:hypothetical protein
MDERKSPVGFEKRNVLNPHDPRFAIVSQENEIVTIKYGGRALALNGGSGQTLRFFLDCCEKWCAVFEIDGKNRFAEPG